MCQSITDATVQSKVTLIWGSKVSELTRDVGLNPCCCCCDHLVVTSCQIQKAVRAYGFAELLVGVCGNFLPQNRDKLPIYITGISVNILKFKYMIFC